jgi:hypothetical protein
MITFIESWSRGRKICFGNKIISLIKLKYTDFPDAIPDAKRTWAHRVGSWSNPQRIMKMAGPKYYVLILFGILTLGTPFQLSSMPGAKPDASIPNSLMNAHDRNALLKLHKAWVRLHKDNLCLDVDATFILQKSKMEVQASTGDEKNYEKLLKILKPVRESYGPELHIVRLPTQREPFAINSIPPSLWTNSELLYYLRDSFQRDPSVFNIGWQLINPRSPFESITPISTPTAEPSAMLQQRMFLFAKNLLDHNWKMERYAAHLPSLARIAFDPAETPELRRQALAVCRAHAREVAKYAKKLNDSISLMMPDASEKTIVTMPPGNSITASASPTDRAERLAAEAQTLCRSVYQFVYPQEHTVTLEELGHPQLLQSLEMLLKMVEGFQNSVS